MLPPPALLEQLLAAGRRPRTVEERQRRNLRRSLPAERVRRLAPEQSEIFLLPPPFRTARERTSSNANSTDPMAAPPEVDFDPALDIGDFGRGSDAPILLDYREDPEAPRVIRPRRSPDEGANHRAVMAPTFELFVRELGP